ncbi:MULTISPECIES: GrxA family glutaredoxin [Cronobacter]|uniref:GrxA family glutaredoxin n=1 Tax=Cronobacter TaxID=413496 RepID=UPI000CFD98CE|nr:MULTISPECIES: GrxA family glutaredoxin [Cronobacter]
MAEIKIYGKDMCTFCKRAKELAEQLQSQGKASYEYIDIVDAGIDAAKLSEMVGAPVRTIPQIFVDGRPVGGYTEFSAMKF